MQAGIYSAVLSFSSVVTIFDALIALGSRDGQARINPLFGGVLVIQSREYDNDTRNIPHRSAAGL